MTTKDAISKFLKDVSAAIKKDQRDKGIVSSEESAKSLRETATNTEGKLIGRAYFFQQFKGRRPGKFPPIEDIIQWIRNKGISPVDISERSLAFIIARKISRLGTDIFQKKRPGIDINKITEDRLPTLMSDIKKIKREEYRMKFKRALQ